MADKGNEEVIPTKEEAPKKIKSEDSESSESLDLSPSIADEAESDSGEDKKEAEKKGGRKEKKSKAKSRERSPEVFF